MTPKESELKYVFDMLQKNAIEYIVLRGFSELPDLVSYDNDVDLLCKSTDNNKIRSLFSSMNYKFYQDSELDNRYLYHALPHHHFRSKSKDIHVDVVFNLAYRSPNNDEWVSVHEDLQESIWKNRVEVGEFWLYQPSFIDEFIHLVCHSIYDKKKFHKKHEIRINDLFMRIDLQEAVEKLEHIFFKFTPTLIEQIRIKNYSGIVKNYISFKDY